MVWWRMDVTPSFEDNKEKIVTSRFKKVCIQNKKNYKSIKSGVMNIFIYHTEEK